MNTDNSDTIKKNKGDKQRPALKKRFLELLSDEGVLGNVSTATKMLGINRDTVYHWRAKDQKFAKEWEIQIGLTSSLLADEAESALLKGIRAGNASLIVFTLKSRRPERWGDRLNQTRKLEEVPTHTMSSEFASVVETLYGNNWRSALLAKTT